MGNSPSGEESSDGDLSASEISPARIPLACVETLGQSALERAVGRLSQISCVKSISIFAEDAASLAALKSAARPRGARVVKRTLDRWLVLDLLKEQAQLGFDKVLLIRMNAHVEFDFEDLLRFHEKTGEPITRVHDSEGPLDFWLIDTDPSNNPGKAFNWRSGSGTCTWAPYVCKGYVNRLRDAHDLRCLVMDAFLLRCSIVPRGREIKPGIWVDAGAHVHPNARIGVPAYIGKGTRVGESAFITKFSNVEQHCDVGAGTAIVGSSVLPHTRLGRALFVNGSVVDGNRLSHLARNLTMEVADQKLMASIGTFKTEVEHSALLKTRHLPAKVAASSLNFSEGEV